MTIAGATPPERVVAGPDLDAVHEQALLAKREQLIGRLQSLPSVAVAFSGGVDSAVVAQAAYLALGARSVAVTGVSASLAAGELAWATSTAQQIGIRHVVLETDEFSDPNYLRNAPDRCYHCKTELYTQLEKWAPAQGISTIVNGANLDDLGDYRPGLAAAREHSVLSPLAECGLNKQEVRRLAEAWGLPVWDKPASPCLSSRVAYGEAVTPARLAMIDAAEQFLRKEGFPVARVRYHKGDLARVEVPREELDRVLANPFRDQLVRKLLELGFKFVTIDLAGFKSGSLNVLVTLQPARLVD
ncbi:MAG: ATP-dependent sacrificial sulfur transferase LarE [Pirellulales bacterium]